MRKNVLMLYALLLFVVSSATASPVSRAAALEIAREFMQAKGMEMNEAPRMVQRRTVQQGTESQTVPAYYVFANGEEQGFVIVSGDDRCYPVLGYSETGNFNEEVESLSELLQLYADVIVALDDNVGQSSNAPAHASQQAKSAVQPMITAKWGQKHPYNNKCPLFKDNENGITGCVATAISQLLYYYRDRNVSTTKGEIPSYTYTYKYYVSRTSYTEQITIPAIPAGTKIDWANMRDVYVGTETAAEKNAVAELAYYAGNMAKTYYRHTASPGHSDYITGMLATAFNFYPGAHEETRAHYESEEWEDLVYNELKSGRPVPYGARRKDYGAHMFLIDGYDGDGLYHVNWGWSGQSDGYYRLSVLAVGESDDAVLTTSGWTLNQSAIFGLQPGNGLNNVDETPVLHGGISNYSNLTTIMRFYNYTLNETNFSYGFGVKDAAGDLSVIGTPNTSTVEFGKDVRDTLALKVAQLKALGLKKGSYKLVPISKAASENVWRECILRNANATYLSFDYNPTSSSITNVVKHPVISLSVSDVETTGTQIANTLQPVKAIVENTSDDTFTGSLYFCASKSSTTLGTPLDYIGLILAPGEKREVEFNFTPTSTGTWYVGFSTAYTGADAMGVTPVTIKSGTVTHVVTLKDIELENLGYKENNIYYLYGNCIRGRISVVNNSSAYFSDRVTVIRRQITTEGSEEFTAESQLYDVLLAPGETKTLEFNFSELLPDIYRHKLVVYNKDTQVMLKEENSSGVYQVVLIPGVNYYDKEGNLWSAAPSATFEVPEEATAVEFLGMTGSNGVTKVVPNTNPNTLYFLDNDDVQPSGLTGKNIVKEGVANSLALTDGYDFATPKKFTAKTVNFTITPTIGATGTGGWFTLALPFAPTKVTANNKVIDWFHSSTDTGKNFWLKEFVGMNGNAINFSFVDEMKANVPYLIAVPGYDYSSEWNLLGKKMVFTGTNQTLYADTKITAASNPYVFAGSTYKTNLFGVWALNSAGSSFVYGNYIIYPFRAYFRMQSGMINAPEILIIDSSDDTDGIMIPAAGKEETVSVYNLSGIKVAETRMVNGQVDIDNLPNGVYVINGQKIIK